MHAVLALSSAVTQPRWHGSQSSSDHVCPGVCCLGGFSHCLANRDADSLGTRTLPWWWLPGHSRASPAKAHGDTCGARGCCGCIPGLCTRNNGSCHWPTGPSVDGSSASLPDSGHGWRPCELGVCIADGRFYRARRLATSRVPSPARQPTFLQLQNLRPAVQRVRHHV